MKKLKYGKNLIQANLANHPLGAAYNQKVDVVLKGETPWNIEDLFDRDKRFLFLTTLGKDHLKRWVLQSLPLMILTIKLIGP